MSADVLFLHGPAASATTATATRSRWSRVSHVWCDVCSLSPDVAQFYPSLQRSALSTPPTLPRPQRFFCALRALRLPDLRHPGLFSSCARVSELSPCPTSQDVSILVCFLMRPISPCDVFYVLSNDGASRVSLRSEMIKTLASHIWWGDGAEAPRWDGADRDSGGARAGGHRGLFCSDCLAVRRAQQVHASAQDTA